jgi:hypothetical protein
MPTRTGGCHCGAVRFEVRGEIRDVVVCNCSICAKTAYLHWEVEPERFRLLTPASAFETYRFGTMTSQNHFCRTCGISPFRRSRTAPHLIDVNVRCLDGVDVDSVPVEHFDGRNWEQAQRRRQR